MYLIYLQKDTNNRFNQIKAEKSNAINLQKNTKFQAFLKCSEMLKLVSYYTRIH